MNSKLVEQHSRESALPLESDSLPVGEDTPHAIRDQLARREPQMGVLAVGDDMVPAFGTPDLELLHLAGGHLPVHRQVVADELWS